VKLTRIAQLGAITAAAALVLAGCAANEAGGTGTPAENGSTLAGTLSGMGASSMGAAQEAWIAAFQTANSDVTVNYAAEGSGAGREGFQAGAADYAGSDRAFTLDEIAEGPFDGCAADSGIIQLPLYISPIAVVFNLEGIDSLDLDADTIAGMFAGTITSWNDPAIAEQNPDATLPDLAITPVHRSDDSGTTENFTDYLFQAAPSVWTWEADGVWPETPVPGEAAAQTSGVIAAVTGGAGTIGYADASRAGDLGTVALKVGSEYVPFTPEAAAKIVDASPLESGRESYDIAVELDRTSEAAGVYPIVLISYTIACETYADPAVAALVKPYLEYLASTAGQDESAAAAGSAPISEDLRTKVDAAIALIS
jgi:phosphate transport system substrate-binding protein